jgi:peptide-methionine (S)-S-oxide reductase
MVYKTSFLFIILFSLFATVSCSRANGDQHHAKKEKPTPEELSKLSKAYFASGCFWCVEAVFESVKGVKEVISGYSGGEIENPTYQQVSSGRTKHAETVEVYYDPGQVSFQTLLKVFFGSHDPTTLNRQGPDVGSQYRSIVFYRNEEEKQFTEDYIKKLDVPGQFNGKIVTEVKAFHKFYKAEEYHQDYERNHPNDPYIRSVSIPRFERFKVKFPALLKTSELSH